MVKVMRNTIGRGYGPMLKDNDAVLEMLSATKDIQWVFARPAMIKEAPSKGKLRVAEKAPAGPVSFVDLAEFDLLAVQTAEYNHKAPLLAY
jgi:putative NADH-flavin reductase